MKPRPNINMQIVDTPLENEYVQLFSLDEPRKGLPRFAPAGVATGSTAAVFPPDPPETIVGTGDLGTISLTAATTNLESTGVATGTVLAGKSGHVKKIKVTAFVGTITLTVSGDGVTQIIMDSLDDNCTLQWTGTGWALIENNGCVIT